MFISDAHGKNVKQLTDFNCASFAPTFTPDGKQILFSSNKHNCDGRKFELYLINIDGTGLRQVTDFGGFTSFPGVFTRWQQTGICLRLEGPGTLRVQRVYCGLEPLMRLHGLLVLALLACASLAADLKPEKYLVAYQIPRVAGIQGQVDRFAGTRKSGGLYSRAISLRRIEADRWQLSPGVRGHSPHCARTGNKLTLVVAQQRQGAIGAARLRSRSTSAPTAKPGPDCLCRLRHHRTRISLRRLRKDRPARQSCSGAPARTTGSG